MANRAYDELKVSDETGEAVLANITADRAISATTIEVDSVDNWPNKFIFATGDVDANSYIDPSSMTVMYGHLDTGDIIIDGYAPGYSDAGNTSGQVAVVKPNTYWADEIVQNAAEVKSAVDTGWIDADESWVYDSWTADTRTGTITVPTDATNKYSVGMRIRISQSTGGTKYGIITAVTATVLTIYFGTDYTLNNETISSPFYSVQKAPFGFPLNPSKWTQQLLDTTTKTTASSSYVSTGLSLNVPIGVWELSYEVVTHVSISSAQDPDGNVSLSINTTSVSDAEFTSRARMRAAASAANNEVIGSVYKSKVVSLTTADEYFLIFRGTAGSMNIRGADGTTKIRAVCAYL